MRLDRLRIGLWMAALIATVAFTVFQLRPGNPILATTAASTFAPTFRLADGEGRIRDSDEFSGRWLLVFFGFTNCPDVCPTTLSEVAQVMDDLGPEGQQVQPIFVSIDPERDRAASMDEYTKAFHPAILGLAGDAAQTRAAAESFRIFYEREPDANSPDDYTMSHSAGLFLVGPDGQWVKQYGYGTPAAEILADLQSRI